MLRGASVGVARRAVRAGEQGVEMPWFPEFASAAQLARKEVREAGLDDPVGEFLAALREGDPRILETVWPGEIVIYDPRAGEVRGHMTEVVVEPVTDCESGVVR